jgi:hypothetical protein
LNFGGGLVFFLGDQVQPENYNRLLTAQADEQKHVLPARLVKAVEAAQYGLDPLGYRHPLVSAFRDAEQAGLLTTPLQKYFKLQLAEATRAQVALAVTNGDPFIVEETIGRGRSLLVATTADVSWTAMPMWPSFVPIVQELLLFAIHGRMQEHNLLVGQPLGGLLPQGRVSAIEVRLPSGEAKRAALSGDGADRTWSFNDTMQSGIFRTEPIGRAAQPALAQAFAVNLNTVESDLEQVTPEELAQDVWPGVRYFHRTNWRDADAEVSDEIVVRSRLHLWLLAAAIGLLVTESFLTWFSGRHAQ